MKLRWPTVPVVLYAILLLGLIFPLLVDAIQFLSGLEMHMFPCIYTNADESPALTIYFIAWIVFIILSEVLLLRVPVAAETGRPIRRRSVQATAIGAAGLMAILVMCIVRSILAAIFVDDMLIDPIFWCIIAFVLLNWGLWSWLFLRFIKTDDPEAFYWKLMRRILAGSILELLVAVPSHIIVRNRNDCCASGFTAAGIATGVVMIFLTFGPGVFFLYRKRIREKMPSTPATDSV